MGGGLPLDSTATATGVSGISGISVTAQAKHDEYPFAEELKVTGVATLTAALPPAVVAGKADRAALDLVCVIDRSGSMAGEKLRLVKDTMEFVFRQLRPVDRFALVSYDSNVSCDLPMTAMTSDGMAKAQAAVTRLSAGSCTNLSGGLFEGLSVVDGRTSPAKVCSVLLFTDGLANEGISDKTALHDALSKRMKRTTGTTIYTFGFGSDHDGEMLRMLADCAGGLYYFIPNVDSIPAAFGDCLGGLQTVVAQNIRLSITAEPGTTISRVYNGKYAMDGTIPSTGTIQVSIGDMFDGESKDIVIELSIPKLQQPKPEKHALVRVEVKYFDVSDAGDHVAHTTLEIARPANVPAERPVNERVEVQIGRMEAAIAIEESRKLADNGRLEEARAQLANVSAKMRSFQSASTPVVQGMSNELQQLQTCMASSVAYAETGRLNLLSRGMAYQQQRSNRTTNDDEEADVFETTAKTSFKKKAASYVSSKQTPGGSGGSSSSS